MWEPYWAIRSSIQNKFNLLESNVQEVLFWGVLLGVNREFVISHRCQGYLAGLCCLRVD